MLLMERSGFNAHTSLESSGTVEEAQVCEDADGRSRGFGFVTFAEADAPGALGLHNIAGRECEVKAASAKPTPHEQGLPKLVSADG